MSIGLKRGTVKLEPHREAWESAAAEMIATLRKILGADLVEAQHVGSTAIRLIPAKPIVDIAVGVRRLEDIKKHNAELERAGIIFRGEDHPGQLLYVCGRREPGPDGELHFTYQTHFLHVAIFDGQNWQNYLGLRDYLNSHPEEAQEYAKLKQKLAVKYADDRRSYTAAKSEYIAKLLKKIARDRES